MGIRRWMISSRRARRPDISGWLEDDLEEWLLDGEIITERQYQLVAEDEDAREEILWDLILLFCRSNEVPGLAYQQRNRMMSSHDKAQEP